MDQSAANSSENRVGVRPGVAAMSAERRQADLRTVATDIRASVLATISRAKLGHVGGDFSVTDILVTLVFGIMRLDPARPEWEDRDRLILSKGHCAAALYSVLAEAGFIERTELETFAAPLSRLNGHPNRKIPGVEANTGPLGHGLPIGVGCAIAARLTGASWNTYVVLGDGELQEGSNWEAAMSAGHRGLANLVAIVDRNRLQQGASTEATNRLEPLADKWRSFGWAVAEVDGHNVGQLYDTLAAPRADAPLCIIAHTVKGKGASFMENLAEWHHKVPSAEQVERALAELRA